MIKRLKNKKGFTLIELIVVIAIIAVLAAIIIPSVSQNIQRANEARDLANARATYAEVSIGVLLGDITVGATVNNCAFTIANGAVATFVCTLPSGTYTLTAGVITGP
jgi:prepilin-type N-terminal cleavage/methylation domain-containing protein